MKLSYALFIIGCLLINIPTFCSEEAELNPASVLLSLGVPKKKRPADDMLESESHDTPHNSEREKKQRIDQSSQRHMCPQCGKIFARQSSLKMHLSLHVEKRCPTCDRILQGQSALINHIKTHRPKETFCSICDKNFTNTSVYRKHEKTHKDRPNCCLVCKISKKFQSEDDLRQHMRSHKPTIQCPYCITKLVNRFTVRKHMLEQHPSQYNLQALDAAVSASKITSQDIYGCPECDQEFPDIDRLDNHIEQTHIQFACDHCKKVFGSKTELETHIEQAVVIE